MAQMEAMEAMETMELAGWLMEEGKNLPTETRQQWGIKTGAQSHAT